MLLYALRFIGSQLATIIFTTWRHIKTHSISVVGIDIRNPEFHDHISIHHQMLGRPKSHRLEHTISMSYSMCLIGSLSASPNFMTDDLIWSHRPGGSENFACR